MYILDLLYCQFLVWFILSNTFNYVYILIVYVTSCFYYTNCNLNMLGKKLASKSTHDQELQKHSYSIFVCLISLNYKYSSTFLFLNQITTSYI